MAITGLILGIITLVLNVVIVIGIIGLAGQIFSAALEAASSGALSKELSSFLY